MLIKFCPPDGASAIDTSFSFAPVAGDSVSVHGYLSGTTLNYDAVLAGPVPGGQVGTPVSIHPTSWLIGGKQVDGMSGSAAVSHCGEYAGMVNAVTALNAGHGKERFGVLLPSEKIGDCISANPQAGLHCPRLIHKSETKCNRRLTFYETTQPHNAVAEDSSSGGDGKASVRASDQTVSEGTISFGATLDARRDHLRLSFEPDQQRVLRETHCSDCGEPKQATDSGPEQKRSQRSESDTPGLFPLKPGGLVAPSGPVRLEYEG
eukprot:gene17978-20479_t